MPLKCEKIQSPKRQSSWRCQIGEVRTSPFLSFDGYWCYPASWHSPRADERDRVTSGFALQLFQFICKLDFDFGRKARPTESKESLPRRPWSQGTTNAIKTMLAEKAPSIALIGGASNTKRYLFCRRAQSKGGSRIRVLTGIALTIFCYTIVKAIPVRRLA